MKKYSARMDFDAQAMADLSGIAAGWLQDDSDPQVFKVGCEICEFECGGIVTPALIKLRGGGAENMVESQVWERFTRDAETMKCPHLAKFNFWKSNPGTRPGVEMLAMLKFQNRVDGD